jgi:hypothetical protein
LVPGWFVWRYRRSPYALRWLPRSALGIAISAFGQMLLTNADIRSVLLLLGTVGYVLVQGKAESLRWSSQERGSKADIQDSRPNQPLPRSGHAKDGPFS